MYNSHYYDAWGCGVKNGYMHPKPEPKRRRYLDTVKVEKFTVDFVGENCIEKCCKPVPVGVSIKKPVFILSGITECITCDTYYTLDLDRAIPTNFDALQAFIKAEPCGFCNLGVDLDDVTITVPLCEMEPDFRFTPENLKNFYSAKYPKEEEECECHRNPKVEKFFEVELDLRGNMATTNDFFRHKYNNKWCHRENHRYVLYKNNSNGRLVLTRDLHETYKYGDFR